MSIDPQVSPKVPHILLKLARRFWPELKDHSVERQFIGIGEVASTLYAIPLTIIGLGWLITVTDFNRILEQSIPFLLFAVLIVLFNQFGFFLIIELRSNRYGSAEGALTGIPLWSGVLILGPTVFWLPVLWILIQFIINWSRTNSKSARWGQTRNLAMNLMSASLAPLMAFSVYRAIGGFYPFSELTIWSIFKALVMFGIYLGAYTVIWTPYLIYHTWVQQIVTGNRDIRPILKFYFLAIGLPQLANPFAILAAGLYVQNGPGVFLYFIVGMIFVAYLARRLSWSAERGRQSSRILEKLEVLGRNIINAPLEMEYLPKILQEHITNMFPAGRLVIWTFPDKLLAQQPLEWQPDLEKIDPWLLNRVEGKYFRARDPLPWQEGNIEHNPVIVAPILDVDSSQTIGGIYLELHTLAQPWDNKALQNLCPAVQALAAQIASAMDQVKSYKRALELNRVNEQLELAGEIQASLLPFSFPNMPGWQLAVTFDPAGETSGDFFDIIALENNRIGILIADVLDKGLGPALYMTLSRTLIRTYSTEFDLEPDLVFFATNERILKDTRANLFVTVFYGVLDLTTGEMRYSNAGHNPPYIISDQNGSRPLPLEKTGPPIGIDEEATWTRKTVQMDPGDILVLYTDGVPDAQNIEGEFFKQISLVDVIKENLDQSAEALQKSILDAVYDFVGEAPPFDDITLMVLVRDVNDQE